MLKYNILFLYCVKIFKNSTAFVLPKGRYYKTVYNLAFFFHSMKIFKTIIDFNPAINLSNIFFSFKNVSGSLKILCTPTK